MTQRLHNKTAIVTGAASGIGKAAAALFRAEGAKVIAADRTEGEGVVAADAGSEDDVKRLVDLAVADHGGLDIFFANAGISGGLASIF
jgi:NAD(P)-dependent dehydrogenase (short-subunit alcohol dehydrogenase family)